MSKSANTLAIGLFVIGAIVILMAVAVFVSGGGFGSDREKAVMVFEGSVKGLSVGAPVAFKGVQIGQVTGIEILIDTTTYEVMMPVEIEFSDRRIRRIGENVDEDSLDHLIDRGMRGQLQLQSLLTGLLYIQLDFHPNRPLRYSNIESDLMELPTIPTDLEKLASNLEALDLQEIIEDVQNSLREVQSLASDPELHEMAGNLNATLLAVETLSNQLGKELEQASPGVQQMILHADQALLGFSTELPELSQAAQATMVALNEAFSSLDKAMATVDYSLSDDSPTMYEARKAIRDLGAAGRALQALAETLEKQPEALLKGRRPQE